jgi:hypothetical protein
MIGGMNIDLAIVVVVVVVVDGTAAVTTDGGASFAVYGGAICENGVDVVEQCWMYGRECRRRVRDAQVLLRYRDCWIGWIGWIG